jgi:hypothetical protein
MLPDVNGHRLDRGTLFAQSCDALRIHHRARALGCHVDNSGGRWDNPTMIVTLDSKRRLSVPTTLAPAKPGDQFDAIFDADDDTLVFHRIKRKANWLEVWKKCPVPMDDLPPRSRELPKKLKL